MKKQIFAIAAIVIAGSTALYSCKKTANAPETTAQASSIRRSGMVNMEHYGDKINSKNRPGKECAGDPVDCVILPPVIIQGYDGLEAAAVEGPAGIASFFVSPESVSIREHLGQNITTMLQSGEYAMTLDYKDASTMKFYVGKGQVSSDNFEFALQIPVK